eukprot:m.1584305 g.1584305  ORF g.1584305 m.1584305 type:complete len:77 (+) comp25320_c0_seq49:3985-4215(+)
MRVEEQHRGRCAGDTTHYCPIPLGGTRTGGHVVHAKGEHPDASPAEQHPTAPAVSERWLYGGRQAANMAGKSQWEY